MKCCCSVTQSCLTLHKIPMDGSISHFPVLHHLLELTQTHVRWVGDAIQPSHPLLSSSPPALNLSQHSFSNESALRIRWTKYWSLSISPSSEYSKLIFFRIDWFDFLAVQGTLKSLLQHNSKASIIQCSAFFMVQLQFSSVAQSCLTHYDSPMDCSTPGYHVHQQLPEFTQTHVHWVGDAIQPSHPLSAPSPPAFNLSQHQGLFQWVSSSHQWPKYWSFSFNISPSNEYSGLISFRMDWLDLLALQGTLKSLLQHHSSKALIL